MRLRGPLATALGALIALTPALALPAFATTTAPRAAAAATSAVEAAPKVVIVVGAVQGSTPGYRAKADQIYAEAIKYTPNVIKIYSPNATWAKVKAAAQGASVFVYLGHGYGFPSPYRAILSPDVQNGMGINGVGGVNDSDLKYYGEQFIASEIKFAKNAVVILSGLCYSAGSSEDGHPQPTIPVARQRVDNFASGWIKAGARMVIADSWVSGNVYTVRSLFTTDQTLGDVWHNAPNNHGHVQPFIPVRNPQYEAALDPNNWTTDFYRSFVGATDLRTTDVLAGAGAAPTTGSPDGAGPELWSVDGSRTITPNADGDADTLDLLGRFSESVSWTAQVRNGDGDVLRTQTGTGHQAAFTWDARVAGETAPAGDYTWRLQATDAAGNAPLDESGPFTIEDAATPDTGVPSFAPTTPTTTTLSTISYALHFAAPVTGLAAGDFTRTGTSSGCVVGAPVGSGADYTIALTSCATGSVGLYLNAGTVTDAALNVGPAGPISAARVTIDRTAPTAHMPKANLRTGVALAGSSTSQALLGKLTWGGSDTGSGIGGYDVQRSYDGGAYTTLASNMTVAWMNVSLNPSHTYRFRVRARDKAGNVGAWVTTSTWTPALTQNSSTSVAYTGTWSGSSAAQHSGTSVRSSSTAGASATLTFSGRTVAWVTTLRPTAGAVQVWVDGSLAATINTNAATTVYRQVVFTKTWSSYGSHKIKLVVVGTAGHARADVDAFEIIR